MANPQVRDILDEARAFHTRLAGLYQKSVDSQGREKMRMLLYYLSRHETHLEEAMKAFAAEGRKQLLDTWVPDKSVENVMRQLRGLSIPTPMNPDELVRRALQYDDHLVSLFRLLAEKGPDEDVRQLFLSLVRLEQKAESTLARDTAEFSDL